MESDASYARLLDERLPLYRRFCDIEVDASGSPQKVAGRVRGVTRGQS
jgi:hypothetical protein